jgi:hypothetical protein
MTNYAIYCKEFRESRLSDIKYVNDVGTVTTELF